MKDIPAFPNAHYSNVYGMTLRDYFAAKALQGALSGCAARGEVVMYSEMASLAYEMADAMMKARTDGL